MIDERDKIKILLSEHQSTSTVLSVYVGLRYAQFVIFCGALGLLYGDIFANFGSNEAAIFAAAGSLSLIFWLIEYRTTKTWEAHRDHLRDVENLIREDGGAFLHPRLADIGPKGGYSVTRIISWTYGLLVVIHVFLLGKAFGAYLQCGCF